MWDVPTAASLPRLLAPEAPSPTTTLAPYALAATALILAARAGRRRAARGDTVDHDADREGLLFFAGAVACVVTSPSGWTMGLVWALPMVACAARIRADGRARPPALVALGAAWLACAVPPPFAGWPALAGTTLGAAAIGLACAEAK
jgi:hypothetical protein